MAELEARMAGAGVAEGKLNSTATALPFYRSIGWIAAGPAHPDTGQPMTKSLQSATCTSDI